MTIKVIRILEYTYDSVEAAESDISNWYVQAQAKLPHYSIKSTILSLEVFKDTEPAIKEPIGWVVTCERGGKSRAYKNKGEASSLADHRDNTTTCGPHTVEEVYK